MNKTVKQLVNKVDRKSLTNTQKILVDLVKAEGWVSRSSMRVPNATSRIRDLRTADFGRFDIECKRFSDLPESDRPRRTPTDPRETFYRVNPSSLTTKRLETVFGEVISA